MSPGLIQDLEGVTGWTEFVGTGGEFLTGDTYALGRVADDLALGLREAGNYYPMGVMPKRPGGGRLFMGEGSSAYHALGDRHSPRADLLRNAEELGRRVHMPKHYRLFYRNTGEQIAVFAFDVIDKEPRCLEFLQWVDAAWPVDE